METPKISHASASGDPIASMVSKASMSKVDDAAYLLRRIDAELSRNPFAFGKLQPLPGRAGKLAFYDVEGANVVIKECGLELEDYNAAYREGAADKLYGLFFSCHKDMLNRGEIASQTYAVVPIHQYGSVSIDWRMGRHVYIVMERLTAIDKSAVHDGTVHIAIEELFSDSKKVAKRMAELEAKHQTLPERWIMPPQVREGLVIGNTTWTGSHESRWVIALPRDFL